MRWWKSPRQASLTAPLGTPGTGTAFANCLSGYTAIGGGVDVSLPGSMKVSALAPTFGSQFLIERPAGTSGAPTGWSGSVRSEGANGVLKVAATCAPVPMYSPVSTGPFTINAGNVSGLSTQCPAGSVMLSGGIDSSEVKRNVVAVSTALFDSNPQFPVDRATGNLFGGDRLVGIYYNYGPGSTTGAVAAFAHRHRRASLPSSSSTTRT
jgi:hypothetical protein